MDKYCVAHKAKMTERVSKNKVDEMGNPKHYWSHVGPDDQMCFGIGKPEPGEYKKTIEDIEEEEEAKVDRQIAAFKETLDGEEEIEEDEGPMKKSDWERKERRIGRLTLAKQYIGAAITFDEAVKNGDLVRWEHWYWNGRLPGPSEEE